MEMIEQYASRVDRVASIVAGVRDDQWRDSTPCSEWDVRALTEHIVGGLFMFGAAAAGRSLTPPEPGVDLLGPDPVATYKMAGAQAVDGFSQPGALERMVVVPAGEMPGSVALAIALLDIVVHGWDLAIATGQEHGVSEELALTSEAIARQLISDEMRRTHSPDGVFDAQVQVEAEAAPVDRLVAFLGRRPALQPV